MGENTQRETERMERLWKERTRAINEEERQHRYDQRLSTSPSSHLTWGGGGWVSWREEKWADDIKVQCMLQGNVPSCVCGQSFAGICSSQKSHPGAHWPATNGWLYKPVTSVAVYRTSHLNYSLNWWRPASTEHNEISTSLQVYLVINA